MKVLLMTTPYSVEERYGKHIKKLGVMMLPPLGIAYVAAVLEREGHEVEIVDTAVENMGVPDAATYILSRSYDAIGLSVQTPMYGNFQKLIQMIKPHLNGTPIIAGGPHASIYPDQTLERNPEIDFTVYGEGELTIPGIMDVIEGKKDPKDVLGIAYRKDGKVIKTAEPDFIRDIDNLPYPARHLLKMEKYEAMPSTVKNMPMLHMIASRGCPFRCTFCSSASIMKRTYRYHSPKRVVDEMEHLKDEYGVREICFQDDLFTVNKKWVSDICNLLIQRGLDKHLSWTCHTRVNTVDRELAKLMKKAGCWQMHMGVESASQELLDRIQKGTTPEQARNTVKILKEEGIVIRCYFILGLPGETREDALRTIAFAKEIDPDYAKFSLTTPYPGTELYDQLLREGNKLTDSWEFYKTMGGFGGTQRPYVPEGRTSEDINQLHRMAHKEFYFRPKKILSFLAKTRSLSELKMYTRAAWALWKTAAS